METQTSCPICEKDALNAYTEVKDHFGNGEVFQLQTCSACTGLITNPRPDPDEILKYYKSNSYVSHGSSKGAIFDIVYQKLQRVNLNYKLKVINQFSHGKSLLDFGSGNGKFLAFAKKQGFTVEGVEPDADARAITSKEINVQANISFINKETFNVITAFHVVEHVHQLHETLEALTRKLSKTGTIFLALPNPQSFDAKHYKSYWAGYDVPRHLYHFTQKSLKALATRHNLKVVAIKPLKLDSFYVSLLSEQYKRASLAPLKGLWHGYRSNLFARKTSEYSSLIYILKKQ